MWPQTVTPDPSLIPLLSKPWEALDYAFPPDQRPKAPTGKSVPEWAWQNHLFGIHSITFELCSVVSGISLLQLMQEAATRRG
jgi:hypothetical protein